MGWDQWGRCARDLHKRGGFVRKPPLQCFVEGWLAKKDSAVQKRDGTELSLEIGCQI